MDGNIKLLIEKELEAKRQVENALIYKEEIKKKALVDGEMAVKMIEDEHRSAIRKLENESQERLLNLEKDLIQELEYSKKSMKEKDLEKLVDELCDIITGNQ